jgi:hypothetical protein
LTNYEINVVEYAQRAVSRHEARDFEGVHRAGPPR